MLACLLLAAFNPKPAISLRLLTSRSPALPLGFWLAVGGTGGALFSALATTLALREGSRRSLGESFPEPEPWFPSWPAGGQERDGPVHERAPRGVDPPPLDLQTQAGPERAPGEPPPTVSVPFRVIRRPSRPGAAPSAASPSSPSASVARAADAPVSVAGQPGPDDWDAPDPEDEEW
ncbi:MAG: hypothetical protein ACKO0M_05880 [Cyanobium sp.]